MFTRNDADWLAECLRSAYQARTAAELIRTTLDGVGRRWELVGLACEEMVPNGSGYIAHDGRVHAPPPPGYAACIHDNPTMPALLQPEAPAVIHLRCRVVGRRGDLAPRCDQRCSPG